MKILEGYVQEAHLVPRIVHGQPFYFLRAWLQTVPTGQTAWTLEELKGCIASTDLSAIYYHLIETRRSLRAPGGEMALWIRDQIGREDLAKRVASIDTFMYSLEDLRRRLLDVLENDKGTE